MKTDLSALEREAFAGPGEEQVPVTRRYLAAVLSDLQALCQPALAALDVDDAAAA